MDAFFEDAREKLEGDRPDYDHADASRPASPASAGGDASTGVANSFAWSKLIGADTIETEVKRLSQSVDRAVTTPSEFKGGGYKACRRDFSTLAVLFAVSGQYDGEARWQDAAPGLRDPFARAGYNCKVGTDQTFNEAKQRKQDLADLVRGNRPQMLKADAVVDWGHVADRPPLMQRMNIAHQDRLTKWLADANTFNRNRTDVRHEAQLVAMIAEVISREGFEFWDDADYAGYAHDLKQAATDVAIAANADNFAAARQALTRAAKSCTNCHDAYR